MSLYTTIDPEKLIGREFDSLTYEERLAITGKWVALELYSPKTTPIRRIEAIADSPGACSQAVAARGLNPAQFELSQMNPPY